MCRPPIPDAPSAPPPGRAASASRAPRRLAAWLALAVAVASSALAQQAPMPDEVLRAMDAAVARADFEDAETRAREALAMVDALSLDQVVDVHRTLGVLLHTRNEPVEARVQFEAALSLNPSLRLDPVLVSPKTVEFFDDVRTGFEPDATTSRPDIRYLVLEDQRPGAALRSLAAPGWGQFHKGDRARGLAFAAAAAATAGGLVVSAVQYADARDAYLGACYDSPRRAPAGGLEDCTEVPFGDIEGRLYDRTDRWRRARDAFAIGAAAVWTAAVLDALVTGAPEVPRAVEVGPADAGLRVTARF